MMSEDFEYACSDYCCQKSIIGIRWDIMFPLTQGKYNLPKMNNLPKDRITQMHGRQLHSQVFKY